jgi:hypothetical protein
MNFSWLPFSKQRTVRCPDGTTRYVYKNPDDAFPLFAHDFKARADAAVKAVEGLDAQLGLDFTDQISGFLVKCDTASNSVQLLFRNAYEIFYRTNPCDGWHILVEETRAIISQEHQHRQALIEVERIRAVANAGSYNREDIENAIRDGLERMAAPASLQETTTAMTRAEAGSQKWDEVGRR